MRMARATTSFPDDQLPLLEQRIAALRRPSISLHLAFLIEDDLRAAGLLASPQDSAVAEFLAEVRAAAEANPDLLPKLKAALVRTCRIPATAA